MEKNRNTRNHMGAIENTEQGLREMGSVYQKDR